MRINHQQVNNFFYKYYNNNIEDETILDNVSNTLYLYCVTKIQQYNANKNKKTNYDQFTFALYNTINSDYIDDINTLKNNIK